MLSIIIPTLNEENYLPILLRSIKKQIFKDYEIIVADAGSKDKTIEIARKRGCRVIAGGLPSKGKNEGAEAARGDLLLFLDADTKLSSGKFLTNTLKEFKERKLDIASCLVRPLGKSRFLSQRTVNSLFDIYNHLLVLREKVSPSGQGAMILIKKSLHRKIGGFNENVVLGEDVFYIKKGANKGIFGILRSAVIFYSIRRLEKEKWIRVLFLYFLLFLFVHNEKGTEIFNKGFLKYQIGACHNESEKFEILFLSKILNKIPRDFLNFKL